MLVNEATTSFVLTLQSVPPFVVENMLALALVVLLSLPLIFHIQILLESTTKAITMGAENRTDHCDQRREQANRTVVMHYPVPVKLDSSSNSDLNIELTSMRTTSSTPIVKRSIESLKKKGSKENRDKQLQEQYKRNLRKLFLKKQKTCLPLERSSSFLATNMQLPIIDISAFDYDSYRYKLIEMSLKRQYGNRQAPGNVVLNSIHLNSIGSQSGIQLSEKYSHSLFDLIEEYYDTTKTITKKEKEYLHPLDHFLAKDPAKPITADAETATDQKQLPPTVAFREEPQVPAVVSLTASVKPKIREGAKRASKPKEVLSRTEKLNPAGNQHSKATDHKEKECVTCPSVCSSDAGSSYSSSKPRERFLRSRASSLSSRSRTIGAPSQTAQLHLSGNPNASVNPNCESSPKSPVKTIKPKLSSRPRSSSGRFDWDVPDLPGLSKCAENTEKEEPTRGKVQERPKTANATFNRRTTSDKEKPSDTVLPVLESFVDLEVDVPCNDLYGISVDHQQDHQGSAKGKPPSCDKVNTDEVPVVAKTSSSGTKSPANRHSSASKLPVHTSSYKTKIRTLTEGAKLEVLAKKLEGLHDKSLGHLEKKSVGVLGKLRRPRTAGSVQSHTSSLSPKVELSLEAVQSNDDSSNIFGVPIKESESARQKEPSKLVTNNTSQLKTPSKLASLSGRKSSALRSSTNKITSSINSRVLNDTTDSSKKGLQEDTSSKRPFLRARSGRYGAPKLNVTENEPKESSK